MNQNSNSGNSGTSITSHLEMFLAQARSLETQIETEKKKNQKIAQEYVQVRQSLESTLQELKLRLAEKDRAVSELTQNVQALRIRESQITAKAREIMQAEATSRNELNQFKNAWGQVLTRENEARTIIAEAAQNKSTLSTQKSQIEGLQSALKDATQRAENASRHAENYQKELQSALIRLQSSESKFSQLTKEYQLVSERKRSTDEEIAKIETQMRERFKWEMATEKERLRAEMEKDSTLDRERFRELMRKTVQSEIEKNTAEIRSKADGLERDNARLILENRGLATATARADQAERQAQELNQALSILNLERGKNRVSLEEAKKELSRSMLIERLQMEDTVQKLKAQIENLERADIRVTKVTGPVDGEVLVAYPVNRAHDTTAPVTSIERI